MTGVIPHYCFRWYARYIPAGLAAATYCRGIDFRVQAFAVTVAAVDSSRLETASNQSGIVKLE